MKAILLAAGFATRLHPLTRDQAKPLLDVRGRPVLSWILDRVLAVPQISEVVVVANHRFAADFAVWAAGAPTAVPLRVLDDGATTNQTRLGGVADLALGLAAVAFPDADGWLVLAGDNLLEVDLAACAAVYRPDCVPLLLLRRIDGPVPPRRYGEVVAGADGRVLSFREKPEAPRSNLAASCVYFLPAPTRGWVEDYLRQGGDRDAPGRFLEWLVPRVGVRALLAPGRILDIGDLASLEAARRTFRP